MLTLFTLGPNSEEQILSTQAMLAVLATGEVNAVEQDGSRRRLLSFRPGMARVGRPDIRDGAWYHRGRKLLDVYVRSDEPFSLYDHGFKVGGFRQSCCLELELGSMEGSRPYLWSRGQALAEVHDGRWSQPRTDSASFSCEELLLAEESQPPPSWSPQPHLLSRPSGLAERL